MREIEFRIWDNINESLETVTELDFSGDGIDYLEIRDGDGEVHGLDIRLGGIELSQYTGLRDKNGKKIFEGDIGWDDHTECWGVVVFDEGRFQYVWETVADDLYEVVGDIEIRGNKWQNPELLEAE